MRGGKETYYMAAIYLAPFYLLVCVYILLRSLHWFQVLHTVFRNVWVCRGIGLVYLFVVFSILIAFMAPASGFRRFMKLLSNYWLGVLMYTLMTLGIADGLRLLLKYPLRNFAFPGRELLFSNMGTAVVGAVCAVIISTVSIYGVLSAGNIHTTKYNISVDKKAGNMKELNVVLAADLHLGYNIGCRQMEQMAEKFSVQMAGSFEKVITPTFQKMNDSLDVLVSSVTKCQEDAIREILDTFLKEMNLSFKAQFEDFGRALTQLKDAQTDNANYTTNLYQSMSRQLSEAYTEHERNMRTMLEDTSMAQKEYLDRADRILKDNQTIQKEQQADYQHLADYLKEAEASSAKFWVACNQTMQKYVEAAAQGMDRISAAGRRNVELAQANRQVVAEFDARLQEFMNYQKLSYKTMDQVRRLLADISAAGSDKTVTLSSGQLTQKQSFDKLEELLEQQGEQQQLLLEELNRNLRELTKGTQKGKLGIFR